MKTWIIFGLSFLPLLYNLPWILFGWMHSPLDAMGPLLLLLLTVLLYLYRADILQVKRISDPMGYILIVTSILGIILGVIKDIHVVTSFSSIFLIAGVIWCQWGWAQLVCLWPLFVISILSLPTITHLISWMIPLSIGYSSESLILIKLILVVLLVALFHLVCQYQRSHQKPFISSTHTLYGILLVGVLLFMIDMRSTKDSFGPPLQLAVDKIPSSDWSGMGIPLEASEKDFFMGSNVEKFIYFYKNGGAINVVHVLPGKDIHKIHAPEYCMTGGGWQIEQRYKLSIKLKTGTFPVSCVLISLDGQHAYLYYWYSSSERSTTSQSTFRKAYNPNESWQAYQFAVVGISSLEKATQRVILLLDQLSSVDLNRE